MCKAAQLSYETVSLCGGCTVAPGGLDQAQTVSYLNGLLDILVLGYDDCFMPLYYNGLRKGRGCCFGRAFCVTRQFHQHLVFNTYDLVTRALKQVHREN